MSYFDKIPLVNYNGKTVRNITARVAVDVKSLISTTEYQPYYLPETVRPEHVAFDYYGSPSSDWILYLANDVIDPYYDWALDNGTLERLITKKYGSIPKALQKILYYRVNWKSNNEAITTSEYDTLPVTHKYYYTLDASTEIDGIVSYKRKKIDTIINTNKTLQVTVSNTNGLAIGERIVQTSASAEIAAIVSNTTLIVGKVTGTLSNSSFTSSESGLSRSISDQVQLKVNIGDDVSIFWEPVSAYDYEFEMNDARRYVTAIDNSIRSTFEEAVETLLNE
jgi:hypothetical protein